MSSPATPVSPYLTISPIFTPGSLKSNESLFADREQDYAEFEYTEEYIERPNITIINGYVDKRTGKIRSLKELPCSTPLGYALSPCKKKPIARTQSRKNLDSVRRVLF